MGETGETIGVMTVGRIRTATAALRVPAERPIP